MNDTESRPGAWGVVAATLAIAAAMCAVVLICLTVGAK